MLDGYSLVFEDFTCYVLKNKTKNNLLAEVPMAKNKIFPYNLTVTNNHALKTTLAYDNWLWHQRYGHLNFRSLSQPSKQNLVVGLLVIKHIDDVCASCVVIK